MVEDEQDCLNVLPQVSAMIAGTKATGLLLLEDHMRGCELNDAIARFTRSVG